MAAIYGEDLSLKEAAQFAGVSEGTMRTWVKNIDDVSRVPGGGYRIPRDKLQGYIAAHKTGSKAIVGATSKGQVKGPIEGRTKGPIDELRSENQRLRLELSERSGELKEVRADLRDAHGEIRKLEAELRAHLSSGSRIGEALSRWIKGK